MPFDLQDHARETMHRHFGFGKALFGRLPFRLAPIGRDFDGRRSYKRERKAGADDQQYVEKQCCAVV